MHTRTLVAPISLACLLTVFLLAGCDAPTSEDTSPPPEEPASVTPASDAPLPGSDKPAFSGLPEDPAKTPQADALMTLPPVRDVALAPSPVDGSEQAQQVLDDAREQLGLGAGSELTLTGHSDDGYGTTYYHNQQSYRGLRVVGATANLEVRGGRAEILSGSWVKDIELDTSPRFTAPDALREALTRRGVPAERELDVLGDSELLVFVSQHQTHLVWRIQARLTAPATLPRVYIVDAHDPAILQEQPVFEP